MPEHERFEELCSLAAVGLLSRNEHDELAAHLVDCSSCQVVLQDMTAITDSWVPAASPYLHLAALGFRSTNELRAKFLANARDSGINLTSQSNNQCRLWSRWPLNEVRRYILAGVIGVPIVALVGLLFFVGRTDLDFLKQSRSLESKILNLEHQNTFLEEKVSNETQLRISQKAKYSAQLREIQSLAEQRDEAVRKVATLQDTLRALIGNSDKLQKELALARAELERRSQNYELVKQSLTSDRMELSSLRLLDVENRARLAAQQKKIEELSQRPLVQSAAVDRQRELLAADRDIRDLMGARNLHIIDVHDRDSKGKARRSFGRVFYTEGKSLIFYAFDLSDPKLKEASFQAWGHKEDGSRQAISLGLFYMDDQSQSRWVLRFNDPTVLAEIDSVFVTIEPPGGRQKPSGEKLLYAFLNFDANHP